MLNLTRHDMETCVLGCMLLDQAACDFVLTEGRAELFGVMSHRILFGALGSLANSDTPVDAVTSAEAMIRAGSDGAEASLTVARCLDAVPHSTHVAYYLKSLKEHHKREESARLAESLKDQAADQTEPIEDTLAAFAEQLDSLSADRETQTKTAAVAVDEWLELQANPQPYLPTGFRELDKILLGGARPGEMIVLAARPSVGKSAVGVQIAGRAAFWGRRALVVSLEMRASQITGRLIQAAGGNAEHVRKLALSFKDDVYRIDKICSLIRMEHRRSPLGIVVVDYLQLVEPMDLRVPREQQVSTCSRALKKLANSLQIPVWVLAQLNRDVEKRSGDKARPRLSDLRESGSIEQDADTVVFIHRPGDEDEEDNAVELIVSKQRSGPVGIARAWWDAERLSVVDERPKDLEWARM